MTITAAAEKRRERIEEVLRRYPPVDQGQGEECLELENPCFMTVTEDDDGSYWAWTYTSLEDALRGLEDEALGERSWWPVGLWSLDTGKVIPLNVRVVITVSDDDAACVAEDLG